MISGNARDLSWRPLRVCDGIVVEEKGNRESIKVSRWRVIPESGKTEEEESERQMEEGC